MGNSILKDPSIDLCSEFGHYNSCENHSRGLRYIRA